MAARRDRNLWPAHRLVILVCAAAVLAAGALFGLASTVGIQKALTRLAHPHWEWLVVAVGGEILAYVGYTVAYREVARADYGAELAVPKAAALVAAGFGVFIHGGGFALDRTALRRAGLSRTETRRSVLGLGMLEYAVLAPATLAAAIVVVAGIRPSVPVSPCPTKYSFPTPSDGSRSPSCRRFSPSLPTG